MFRMFSAASQTPYMIMPLLRKSARETLAHSCRLIYRQCVALLSDASALRISKNLLGSSPSKALSPWAPKPASLASPAGRPPD